MSRPEAISSEERTELLLSRRSLKMARSPQAYVRGSTARFYEWLKSAGPRLPAGPGIWICGDCHYGNLGPIASAKGKVDIQIRDLDQSVWGNPVHDLVRLGLSLASAARGLDLSGIATTAILEAVIAGYSHALGHGADWEGDMPDTLDLLRRKAVRRRWKHLARERIEDLHPSIPLGKTFLPIDEAEWTAIEEVVADPETQRLLTCVRSRENDAKVKLQDAAYWVKGCSSLGHLRYAVLVGIGPKKDRTPALVDFKEAVKAAAPSVPGGPKTHSHAERVVSGARALSPYLGNRMKAARMLGKPIVVRELFPQDLKLELGTLTNEQASQVSAYLGQVVGRAHARQMTAADRRDWKRRLLRERSKSLDAPTWYWRAVTDLLVIHEAAYLEHCRRAALIRHR